MKVLSRETTDPGTPFRARHSLRAQHTVASPKHTHPPGSAEHKPATKASHPNGRRDVPCQSTRANGSVSSKLGHPLPQMGKQGLPGAPFPLAARSQHPAVGEVPNSGEDRRTDGETQKRTSPRNVVHHCPALFVLPRRATPCTGGSEKNPSMTFPGA